MDRSKTLHQVSPPFESLSTVNTALHSCLIIALLFIIFCSPDLLLFGCCYLSFSTMRLRCGVQHVGVCHIYQTTVLSPNICPPPALPLPLRTSTTSTCCCLVWKVLCGSVWNTVSQGCVQTLKCFSAHTHRKNCKQQCVCEEIFAEFDKKSVLD